MRMLDDEGYIGVQYSIRQNTTKRPEDPTTWEWQPGHHGWWSPIHDGPNAMGEWSSVWEDGRRRDEWHRPYRLKLNDRGLAAVAKLPEPEAEPVALPPLGPHDHVAWQLKNMMGMKQGEIADKLNRNYDTNYTQPRVSEMLRRADAYADAGGLSHLKRQPEPPKGGDALNHAIAMDEVDMDNSLNPTHEARDVAAKRRQRVANDE